MSSTVTGSVDLAFDHHAERIADQDQIPRHCGRRRARNLRRERSASAGLTTRSASANAGTVQGLSSRMAICVQKVGRGKGPGTSPPSVGADALRRFSVPPATRCPPRRPAPARVARCPRRGSRYRIPDRAAEPVRTHARAGRDAGRADRVHRPAVAVAEDIEIEHPRAPAAAAIEGTFATEVAFDAQRLVQQGARWQRGFDGHHCVDEIGLILLAPGRCPGRTARPRPPRLRGTVMSRCTAARSVTAESPTLPPRPTNANTGLRSSPASDGLGHHQCPTAAGRRRRRRRGPRDSVDSPSSSDCAVKVATSNAWSGSRCASAQRRDVLGMAVGCELASSRRRHGNADDSSRTALALTLCEPRLQQPDLLHRQRTGAAGPRS